MPVWQAANNSLLILPIPFLVGYQSSMSSLALINLEQRNRLGKRYRLCSDKFLGFNRKGIFYSYLQRSIAKLIFFIVKVRFSFALFL